MHRWLLILALLSAAQAQRVDFVNSATGTNDATGASIATAAFSAYAGNAITCGVEWDSTGAATMTGITDTAGNRYTLRPVLLDTTFGNHLQTAYAYDTRSASSNVVTATFSASPSFRRIICHQYLGVFRLLDPFNMSVTNFAGTGTALVSPTIYVQRSPELSVFFASNDDGTTTVYSNPNYTVRVAALANDTGSGDLTNGSPSTQKAVVNASVSSSWRLYVLNFRMAAGSIVRARWRRDKMLVAPAAPPSRHRVIISQRYQP